jgi:hypothetical protein
LTKLDGTTKRPIDDLIELVRWRPGVELERDLLTSNIAAYHGGGKDGNGICVSNADNPVCRRCRNTSITFDCAYGIRRSKS